MVGGTKVRLDGIAELNRGLRDLETLIIPELYAKTVRLLGVAILTSAVAKSGPPGGPNVITGTFRGGWQLSRGNPPSEERPADKDGSRTVQDAQQASAGLRAGESLWVGNPVEYARWLNYGNDKHAGFFILERAINEQVEAFR